jgi:hypothetical protein
VSREGSSTPSADRPDPLAEPEGYSRPRGAAPSVMRSETCTQAGCRLAATAVLWLGCDRGEHAGPLDYCQGHARHVLGMASGGFVTCGPCGSIRSRMRVLKAEGTEAAADRDRVQAALDAL